MTKASYPGFLHLQTTVIFHLVFSILHVMYQKVLRIHNKKKGKQLLAWLFVKHVLKSQVQSYKAVI